MVIIAVYITMLTALFLIVSTLFGSDAGVTKTWSMTLDPFRVVGTVVFFIGLAWSWSRLPRWILTDTALFVDSRDCIPLESIVEVEALGGRRSCLRVGYMAHDILRQVRVSQNLVNQSLLPLYFLLRSKASSVAVLAAAPSPNPSSCDRIHM